MTTRIAAQALLILTFVSGCSSSLGGGMGGTGGGGISGGGSGGGGRTGGGPAGTTGTSGMGGFAATDPRSGCAGTYAVEVENACLPVFLWVETRLGTCGLYRVVQRGFGFYGVTCAYDDQGALSWAERCEDNSPCRRSVGAPEPVLYCDVQRVCRAGETDGGAGTGGSSGSGGSGGSDGSGGVAGRGGMGGGAAGRGGVGGGGPAGATGTGGCDFAATDPLFSCSATYAAERESACLVTFPADSMAKVTTCGAFQAVLTANGFYNITCAYDQQGQLAWAQRCEDSTVLCHGPVASHCRSSVGAPPAPAACDFGQSYCPAADAGRDGATD